MPPLLALSAELSACSAVTASFAPKQQRLKQPSTFTPVTQGLAKLETAVAEARLLFNQPRIPVALDPVDCKFTACKKCTHCMYKRKGGGLKEVPLYSFANGCWASACPPELQDLTFVIEACIALARCTVTWFKFSHNPTGQQFSGGNACIFPQDILHLADSLPPPAAVLAG